MAVGTLDNVKVTYYAACKLQGVVLKEFSLTGCIHTNGMIPIMCRTLLSILLLTTAGGAQAVATIFDTAAAPLTAAGGGNTEVKTAQPAGKTSSDAQAVTSLTIYSKTGKFTHKGLSGTNDLYRPLVRVAQLCFNISSDNIIGLGHWIGAGDSEPEAMFGPLKVEVKGKYIRLSRKGAPGKAPWVNYCSYPVS